MIKLETESTCFIEAKTKLYYFQVISPKNVGAFLKGLTSRLKFQG